MKKKKIARKHIHPIIKPYYSLLRSSIIVSCIGLLLGGIYLFLNTPSGFFLSSNKERVDFNRTTGYYDASGTSANYLGKIVKVPQPIDSIAYANVLGDTTADKRIEVDLTNQRVYAFENGNKVYDFLVSTGKWWPTPTGTFKIWVKYRYVKMSGGSKALGTYYYLPNVPYTMFFYNDQVSKYKGFSLHGTYWHNNFGHPMSHGCVNMKTEEAAQLYEWAMPSTGGKSSVLATTENPGTSVVIYGTTPAN